MEKSIGIKYILLGLGIFVSVLGIYLTESIILNILWFLVIPITGIILTKADLIHPFVWYGFVYTLYAVGYPILYIFNATYDIYIYTKDLMLVQAIFLGLVFLIVGPNKIEYKRSDFRLDFEKKNTILFYVLASLVSLAILEVIARGFTHKTQIYASGSIIVQIGFRAILLLMIVYAINQVVNYVKLEKFNLNQTLIFITISVGIFVFSGERDLLIRSLIVLLFLYYIFKAKQKVNFFIFIFGCLSIVSIPLMAKFKYFGLTGTINENQENFLVTLFNSEFSSASKNLQIILESDFNSYFNGISYWWGLIRAFNLDIIYPVPSLVSWYNDIFFGENRSGQGFSILAEGYVNHGYLGIVFIAIFIGVLIKTFYKYSKKNIYFFVFYLFAIPVFMYTLRADFANFLTPIVAQNLTFLILLLIFNFLNRQFNIISFKK